LTAVTGRRAKASQDTTSYPGDTRAILVVAVDHYRPRTITNDNAARKKALQIATFMVVRAIRAVLCEVHPAGPAPLPSPQFSRID
jgi:hypothetical protein